MCHRKVCELCNNEKIWIDKRNCNNTTILSGLIKNECGHYFHRECLSNFKKLLCPRCGEPIKYLANINSRILEQIVDISFVPLDNNLSIQENDSLIFEESSLIELDLNIRQYGFTGSIVLNLPINYYEFELLKFFNKKTPIQVSIKYSQKNFSNPQKSEETFNIVGYIANSYEEACWKEMRNIEFLQEKDPYFNSGRVSLKLMFEDPLKYFLSKHYPFNIFLNSSYSDIISKTLEELKISNLVELDIDDQYQDFLDKKDFITVPCFLSNTMHGVSFYEYIIKTLYHYNGYIYYYLPSDKSKYGSYKIFSKDCKDDKSQIKWTKYDFWLIRQFEECIPNRYESDTTIYNPTYSADKSNFCFIQENKSSKSIFSKSNYVLLNTPSLFNSYTNNFSQKLENFASLKQMFKLTFSRSGIPTFLGQALHNSLTFSSKNWDKILSDKDTDLKTTQITLSFRNINDLGNFLHHDEKDKKDDNLRQRLAPRKYLKTGIRNEFCLKTTSTLILKNVDNSEFDYFKELKEECFPILLEGVIVVSEDVEKSYTENALPYMLYDGNSTDGASSDVEAKTSNKDNYSLSPLPEHYVAYHIHIPIFDDKEKCIIPAKFIPSIHSNFNFPFYNKQPVLISMYQEYARIVGELDNSLPVDGFDNDKQFKGINFGVDDDCIMSYSDGALNIFRKGLKDQDNNFENKINLDKQGIEFVYQENKKE